MGKTHFSNEDHSFDHYGNRAKILLPKKRMITTTISTKRNKANKTAMTFIEREKSKRNQSGRTKTGSKKRRIIRPILENQNENRTQDNRIMTNKTSLMIKNLKKNGREVRFYPFK